MQKHSRWFVHETPPRMLRPSLRARGGVTFAFQDASLKEGDMKIRTTKKILRRLGFKGKFIPPHNKRTLGWSVPRGGAAYFPHHYIITCCTHAPCIEATLAHEVGHSLQPIGVFSFSKDIEKEADAWRTARRLIGRPWTTEERVHIRAAMISYVAPRAAAIEADKAFNKLISKEKVWLPIPPV